MTTEDTMAHPTHCTACGERLTGRRLPDLCDPCGRVLRPEAFGPSSPQLARLEAEAAHYAWVAHILGADFISSL